MSHGSSDRLCLNGIDAATGEYLVPPLSIGEAAAIVRGRSTEPAVTNWLRKAWRSISQPHLGLPFDIEPEQVAKAGWAIVFHAQERDDVKEALAPLIAHRRKTIEPGRCHVLTYKDGQTRADWLAAHGVAAGSILPERVPYYLLFVGGPERIPFTFCHQLDVEYALGCLQLDTPSDYAHYAQSVIDYETSAAVPTGRGAFFFGTQHAADGATELSATELVAPLAASVPAPFVSTVKLGAEARKEALVRALRQPPAFLFTASHGMGWKKPDPRQATDQGALICQDWKPFTIPKPADYFAAADLPADARVHGLIAFHFACYGAGTPSHDRFLHTRGQAPPAIADRPFVAALPKALLTHPNGGALAVIGHVERAWGYSIATPQAGTQLLPFRNAIGRLARGQPIGHAMKDFNERYAALSTSLARMLEEDGFGAAVDEKQLARAWVEHNDAEGYLVLGDPAVSIRVRDLQD